MIKKDVIESTEAISTLVSYPSLCSEEAIFEICANGDWLYRGGLLPKKFSKLFSSILNCIDSEYFLITPVEKLRVNVVDQALLVVDYDSQPDGRFTLRSSIGSIHSILGYEQFIIAEDSITLTVERGVVAKLNRACFYRFIDDFLV